MYAATLWQQLQALLPPPEVEEARESLGPTLIRVNEVRLSKRVRVK